MRLQSTDNEEQEGRRRDRRGAGPAGAASEGQEMPGEVTSMQIRRLTRDARRPRGPAALALVAVLALLGPGTALAQSTIDAGSFSTQSSTVWQYLLHNSARRSASSCLNSSSHPDESFTCLQAVLRLTGLDATLGKDGNVTLFAPTDAGFQALAKAMGSGPFNGLMSDRQKLTTVLKGLMVQGRYTSADLKARSVPATGRLSLPTLAGTQLQLTFDRFPSSNGRVKVAVGRDTFQPEWTAYLSGHTTLLNDGSVIPMDMVYLPRSMR